MEEYRKLVKRLTPKENKWKNSFMAFFSGGVIGAISELISSTYGDVVMLIFWIAIGSLITALTFFDSLVDIFKMGLIIPITGFAHSVASSSLEYKKEGFITGIGANYLKLAGSVILYGIISAAILAGIRSFVC